MRSSRSAVLLIATSCAATLALVATVNTSCGAVQVPSACADQCADVAALQDRIAALEGTLTTLQQTLEPTGFMAYLGAAQSVDPASDDLVSLDNVVSGEAAFDRASHEYIAPVAGWYMITATVGYTELDKARANAEIWIGRMNLPAVQQATATVPGNSSGFGSRALRISSATVVELQRGDRVSLRTFHDYTASRTLAAGLRDTNLQIVRIPGLKPSMN